MIESGRVFVARVDGIIETEDDARVLSQYEPLEGGNKEWKNLPMDDDPVESAYPRNLRQPADSAEGRIGQLCRNFPMPTQNPKQCWRGEGPHSALIAGALQVRQELVNTVAAAAVLDGMGCEKEDLRHKR